MTKNRLLIAFHLVAVFSALTSALVNDDIHFHFHPPSVGLGSPMRCSYGERGSLTATCINATYKFFKETPYRFDHLDETLKCENCTLPVVETETFDISGNQIQNLILENSQIGQLKPRSFVGLIFLTYLDLSHNVITSIAPETFAGVKKVISIDLAHNELTDLADNAFKELINLKELQLHHNKLTLISANAFNGLDTLVSVNLEYNNLTDLGDVMKALTNIQFIDLAYNQLTVLKGQEFQNLSKLLEINLSHNKLTKVAIQFVELNSLQKLDLSFNALQDLPSDALKRLRYLEVLDLSNNYLTEWKKKCLIDMHSLHSLNLAGNRLTRIQTGMFTGLPQLRELNCSQNKIEEVEITGVMPLNGLHTLDFSSNALSDLDYSALVARLPLLAYLKLDNNPLSCDLENDMAIYFAEDNFKYILYSESGGNTCVNRTKSRTFQEVADQLIQTHSEGGGGGSKPFEIFLLILSCVLIFAVGYLYYLQYKNVPLIKPAFISQRPSASTVNLVSSDLERGSDDYLRE